MALGGSRSPSPPAPVEVVEERRERGERRTEPRLQKGSSFSKVLLCFFLSSFFLFLWL